MKRQILLVATAVFLVMTTGGIFSAAANGQTTPYPAEPILLGDKKPAQFNHSTHVDLGIECGRCHHDADHQPLSKDAIGAEKDRQLRCAKCHNEGFSDEKLQSLRNIFHARCRDCHKNEEINGKKGPTKCTDCHIKQD